MRCLTSNEEESGSANPQSVNQVLARAAELASSLGERKVLCFSDQTNKRIDLTMSEAKKIGGGPVRRELEEGKTYAYCTCGESANQPFCDGSLQRDGVSSSDIQSGKEWSPLPLCLQEHWKQAPFATVVTASRCV